MPFTVRQSVNAATMVSGWQTGVARSGAKWAAGTLNPRRAFNASPQQNGANWAAGVAAAQPRYVAGLTNVNLAAMEASINANGIPRYAAAAQSKVAKFQAKSAALAGAITAALAGLPADRSTTKARIARSTAFQTAMAANKGKI